MASNDITGKRIARIDIARFYGMILVYYGHIVEQVMYLDSAEAGLQYKFIYSFHMPLFFLLSGTIVADRKLALPIGSFFKRTMAARLVPYLFFSLLMGLVALFVQGWHPLGALTDSGAYLKGLAATLMGFPAFCIPLWFMALLISVEMFHYLVSRLVTSSVPLAVVAVLLYAGGYYLNAAYFFVGEEKAFWFINEVPVVYGFYVAGILLRRSGWIEQGIPGWWSGLGAMLCLVLVAATFDANNGPFRILQAVVIVLSGHGHVILFPLTALIGSLFILLAANSSPSWAWLAAMGKNALSLFCLNGLFYHFINPVAARWFSGVFVMTHATIVIYSTVMTVISLLLCVPLVFLLTTYLPQWMGKPAVDGPLLKPLLRD